MSVNEGLSVSYTISCTEGERRLASFAAGTVDPEEQRIELVEQPIDDIFLPEELKGRTLVTAICLNLETSSEFAKTFADLKTRYRRIGS